MSSLSHNNTIQVAQDQIVEECDMHTILDLTDDIRRIKTGEISEKDANKKINELLGDLSDPNFLDKTELSIISIARDDIANLLDDTQISDKIEKKLANLYKKIDEAFKVKKRAVILSKTPKRHEKKIKHILKKEAIYQKVIIELSKKFDKAIEEIKLKEARLFYIQIAGIDMVYAATELSEKLDMLSRTIKKELQRKKNELKTIFQQFKHHPNDKKIKLLKAVEKMWKVNNMKHFNKLLKLLDNGIYSDFFRSKNAEKAMSKLLAYNSEHPEDKLLVINNKLEAIKQEIMEAIILSANFKPVAKEGNHNSVKNPSDLATKKLKKEIHPKETRLESIKEMRDVEVYASIKSKIEKDSFLKSIFADKKDKKTKETVKKVLIEEFGHSEIIEEQGKLPNNFMNINIISGWLVRVGALPSDIDRLKRRIQNEEITEPMRIFNKEFIKNNKKQQLRRKFLEALEDDDIFSADIFLQDMEKIDEKMAGEMQKELSEYKKGTFKKESPANTDEKEETTGTADKIVLEKENEKSGDIDEPILLINKKIKQKKQPRKNVKKPQEKAAKENNTKESKETYIKNPERVSVFSDIPNEFFLGFERLLDANEKSLIDSVYDVMNPDVTEEHFLGIDDIRQALKTYFTETYNSLPNTLNKHELSPYLSKLKTILKPLTS